MRITVFNGSPRGANSNTHIIADAMLEGAKKAGAEVEEIFLCEQDIKHCNGCFACWFKTPGKCVHRDDMDELIKKYLSSDIVCYGTPVYLWNMTAYLKNFLDRTIPLKSPIVVENEGNFDMEDGKFKLPKVVIISNAGFPGDNNFETMKAVVKSGNPILEIYRNCGMILKSKDPEVSPKIDKYLEVVSKAGFELATNMSVTDETRDELDMDIMSVEKYVQFISK